MYGLRIAYDDDGDDNDDIDVNDDVDNNDDGSGNGDGGGSGNETICLPEVGVGLISIFWKFY